MENSNVTVCPVTGLKRIEKPAWRIVSSDGKYSAQFSIIGGSIVHSDVCGFTTIDISRQYLDMLDSLCDSEFGNKKVILVENYGSHTGTSSEARNYYLARQRKNPRIRAVIFYQTSAFFSMIIRVGRLFAGLPYEVEIAPNYGTAISTAISIENNLGDTSRGTKKFYTRDEMDAEIRLLIGYLGSINWKDPGLPDDFGDRGTQPSEEFRPLYDALSILKNDYDEIETAKSGAITRAREMQEQLHHAERMQTIGTLTGGIAHDFNNMMSAITGFAALLKKKYGETEPGIDRYSNLIIDTGNRASELVQKLLSFARKGKMEKVPVSVGDIFEDLAPLLQHVISKRISISFDIQDTSVKIMGDRAQIQNALLNLSINAMDAMQGGGSLSVKSELVRLDEAGIARLIVPVAPETYLDVSVTDTGSGMTREIAEKIFEPFFTTKENGKGTGLGLSNVLSMVRNHGGSIGFATELGKGTEFHLYFRPL